MCIGPKDVLTHVCSPCVFVRSEWFAKWFLCQWVWMLSFLALNLEMVIVFSFRGMSNSHSYISIWCCHYAFQTFYPQSIKYRQQCHCECLEIILQSDDRPFYRKTVHKYKYTVTVMSGGSAQGISLMDVYPFKHLSLKNSWCHISSAWEINLLACVSNIVNKSSTFKRQEADFIGPTTVCTPE